MPWLERKYQQPRSHRVSAKTTVREPMVWLPQQSGPSAIMWTWMVFDDRLTASYDSRSADREEICRLQQSVCHPAVCFFFSGRCRNSWRMTPTHHFVEEIDRRMSLSTANPRKTAFLYQLVPAAVQCYSVVYLANANTMLFLSPSCSRTLSVSKTLWK